LLDELGMDVEYRASGVLRVALDEREAADLRGRVSWQLQRGLKVEWLEPDEVARREPLFAGAAGKLLVGALWLPEESQTRPPRLVQALAATAARAGADIVEGTPVIELLHAGSRVTGVRIPGGDIAAGTVVLAAGAWSSPLLAPVLPVAVEPIKGQILSLGSVGIAPRHVTWAGHCYIAPKSDGEVIVGATEERAGYDTRPTLSGLAQLATEATTVMPALGRLPVLRQWAGLRPATADRLPVIGAVPGWSGLFVATAHFRNGVLLGPLTGKVIAAAIQGKPAPFDVTPYSPARFVN
jgi:glycine oxidase